MRSGKSRAIEWYFKNCYVEKTPLVDRFLFIKIHGAVPIVNRTLSQYLLVQERKYYSNTPKDIKFLKDVLNEYRNLTVQRRYYTNELENMLQEEVDRCIYPES